MVLHTKKKNINNTSFKFRTFFAEFWPCAVVSFGVTLSGVMKLYRLRFNQLYIRKRDFYYQETVATARFGFWLRADQYASYSGSRCISLPS